MDLKKIQELIQFVSQSGVSEVELETKEFKIIIKSDSDEPVTATPVVVQAAPQAPVVSVPEPVALAEPVATPAPVSEPTTDSSGDESNYITVKSPMIGTFYRSPSPDKPAFVSVGDGIEVGSVICIIEAMKLFNEIEAEVSGKIVKVLVDDSTPVEYDTPLFLVDPS